MSIFDEFLREREELKDSRLKEQKHKNDYSYEQDGSVEECGDCRTPINTNGHCPSCDY